MKNLHLFQSYMPESGIGQPCLKVKSSLNYPFLPIKESQICIPFIFLFFLSPASSPSIRAKENTVSGATVDLEFLCCCCCYTKLDDVTIS